MSSSIDYALRTLILLGQRDRLGVSDVADELGVARSTAHRTLSALCARGFSEQQPGSRQYTLGPAVAELLLGADLRRELIPTARPYLEHLARLTHETVNLIALSGVEAVFLDGVDGPQALRVATRIGDRIPAHSAAGGKALLAALNPERVQRLYSQEPLPQVTSHTVVDLSALQKELAHIAHQGYAVNAEEALSGVHAIGVAMPNPHGDPIAAVTVAMPSTRFETESLATQVQMLTDSAEAIADALRTHPDRPT